jgi:hypothetical protein
MLEPIIKNIFLNVRFHFDIPEILLHRSLALHRHPPFRLILTYGSRVISEERKESRKRRKSKKKNTVVVCFSFFLLKVCLILSFSHSINRPIISTERRIKNINGSISMNVQLCTNTKREKEKKKKKES